MWSQLWIAYIWCETSLNSNTQIHNYKNTQIQKAQFFQHVTVLGGRECEVCSLTNYFWFLQFLEDDLILSYKVVRIEHFVRISRLCSLIFLSIIDIVLATVELTVQRDIAREGLSYVFIGRLCSLIFILQSSTFMNSVVFVHAIQLIPWLLVCLFVCAMCMLFNWFPGFLWGSLKFCFVLFATTGYDPKTLLEIV